MGDVDREVVVLVIVMVLVMLLLLKLKLNDSTSVGRPRLYDVSFGIGPSSKLPPITSAFTAPVSIMQATAPSLWFLGVLVLLLAFLLFQPFVLHQTLLYTQRLHN
jgi:hypothetical protein